MGLLSTEVEVRLTGSNIKYYEDLGYEIPRYFNKNNNKYMVKRGTTILVKIKDLKIDLNYTDLIIKSADEFKIETTDSSIKCKGKNSTLTIKDKKNYFNKKTKLNQSA